MVGEYAGCISMYTKELGSIWKIRPDLGLRCLFWILGLYSSSLGVGFGPILRKGKKVFYLNLDS